MTVELSEEQIIEWIRDQLETGKKFSVEDITITESGTGQQEGTSMLRLEIVLNFKGRVDQVFIFED
ncbi:MAG: hypothetical protein ACTSP1_08185 [Candidatus Freyarchaeota archaeon]